MQDAFQTCAHCGTLNFEGKKFCSDCKFRLPDLSSTSVSRNSWKWNSVIVGMVLIALGLLFVAALISFPF